MVLTPFSGFPNGTGDVLLNINGIDLTNLSHSEAVAMLKASAASPAVVLKALEVQIMEEAAQTSEELPGAFSENEYDASWSPSWVMWLGLPRYQEHSRCLTR